MFGFDYFGLEGCFSSVPPLQLELLNDSYSLDKCFKKF